MSGRQLVRKLRDRARTAACQNFPNEAFWWAGESTLTYPSGEALLVLAQEAAFANGPIEHGQQVAFGRIRIRATGLVPNAW